MLFQTFLLPLLAVSAAAMPRLSPVPRAQLVTDTFDNVTGLAGAALVPIGFQNNLNYGQFATSVIYNNLEGTIPASSPNCADISVRSTLLDEGELSLNPQATAYKDGAILSFDLIQFFFGCVTMSAQANANLAVGCGISVTGYNTAGQMVGEASYNFAPSAEPSSPMVKAVLPSTFVNLVNVTYAVATSDVTAPLTVIELDNVTRINYF